MAEALRLGTRGSALALAQAATVARALEAHGAEVEVIAVRTSGDEPPRSDPRRADFGDIPAAIDPATEDKARFVKELEQALLAGEIDLAVHSAKDVPSELLDGLEIVAVPERADARDALCMGPGLEGGHAAAPPGPVAAAPLAALPKGATVGTASLRRRSQLLALRPDLVVRELRGNVDTRLRRIADGELDAALLAAAGLARLDRSDAGRPLPETTLVPAPGQGCLALEARSGDNAIRELARRLTDQHSFACLIAERAVVMTIEATCDTPVGAHATIDGDAMRLSAYVGAADGSDWIRDELAGDPGDPAMLGVEAGDRLLKAGAREILAGADPRR